MGLAVLKVQERELKKKNELKKLRKEGFIPAIIYAHNKKTKQIKLNRQEVDKTLNHYGVGSSVYLEMGNEIKHAIIKDIQRHTTKLNVLHIDLQELDANEKVRVKIPIHLVNKSAVESSTSVIQQQMTELEIQTYPKYLKQSIEVDVSNIKYGEPFIVSQLEIYNDPNIEVLNGAEEIVALLTESTKLEEKEDQDSDDLLKMLY
ncbi:50S ribosomal protein L25 [Crassaminicella thermophila]|uniref:Large ribosomal subunit protein bL25 n=1 Tax=Crassaminicella thermophila TaxID=2599308 RepID=A0A5C0SIA4_CRATE|nr:50S ribosomal protein L25 [Crassaminicella thermophila]QEK13407.1 50S ribosomal protein L25 [Crassaminicella thermophila]